MSNDVNNSLKVTDVDGRPSLFIYESQSGVVWHVKPLNLATLRAIQMKAVEKFPYPDPKPYQQPEENSFDPNQMTPASNNPVYVELCREKDVERTQWTDRTIFNYAARCPKYPTREALVQAFADELKALREIAVLPDDDYEAVLFHLVLTFNQVGEDANGRYTPASSDYTRIIRLAIQTVALTPDEVSAGIRFFRPQLSGR